MSNPFELAAMARALTLLLLLSSTARAEDRLAAIVARQKLIVSVKNDAKKPHRDPAHFQKRGFEVELSRALARRIVGDESRLELRMLARPARLPMLASGAVDLVVSMIPVTDENTTQCDFSHPYFASGLSLLLPEGKRVGNLAELAGATVAFRKQSFNDYGGELSRVAAERGVKLTVRYYPSFDAAVEAVRRGEALAMGGNFVDLDTFAKSRPGFSVNKRLLEERLIAVAVRKGDASLLRVVNETIDELKRSGTLRRMTDKWRLPYLLPDG
jgi:putative glutamine transport system substrate-binding protein